MLLFSIQQGQPRLTRADGGSGYMVCLLGCPVEHAICKYANELKSFKFQKHFQFIKKHLGDHAVYAI